MTLDFLQVRVSHQQMLHISIKIVSNLAGQFFDLKWLDKEIISTQAKGVYGRFTMTADNDDRCQWRHCFYGREYFKTIDSLHNKVGDD